MAQSSHAAKPEASPQVVARNVFLAMMAGASLTIGIVVFFVLYGGGGDFMLRFVPGASSYAGDVDFVITLIAALVGFWFLAAISTFFWLIWRFRERPGHKAEYLSTHEELLHRWVSWPHTLVLICDILIIAAAVRVWYVVKETMPPADYTIGIQGQQWAWTFDDPGKDGQYGTADDVHTVDELHVVVNKVYHFKLTSRDVVHSLAIPAFRLKQDAVPGREIDGWFKPTKLGVFDIQCDQMCGIGHGLMAAKLYVETPEQHAKFLATHAPNPPLTIPAYQ